MPLMMPLTLPLLPALIALLGCTSPPLTEGTYLLLLESQTNTCGRQDRDFGVGETSSVYMTWTTDTTLRMESGTVDVEYLYAGDYLFAGSASTSAEVNSRCTLVMEFSDEGTMLDPETFRLFELAEYSVEGPCSNIDVSEFPCEAQFEMIAFLDD